MKNIGIFGTAALALGVGFTSVQTAAVAVPSVEIRDTQLNPGVSFFGFSTSFSAIDILNAPGLLNGVERFSFSGNFTPGGSDSPVGLLGVLTEPGTGTVGTSPITDVLFYVVDKNADGTAGIVGGYLLSFESAQPFTVADLLLSNDLVTFLEANDEGLGGIPFEPAVLKERSDSPLTFNIDGVLLNVTVLSEGQSVAAPDGGATVLLAGLGLLALGGGGAYFRK